MNSWFSGCFRENSLVLQPVSSWAPRDNGKLVYGGQKVWNFKIFLNPTNAYYPLIWRHWCYFWDLANHLMEHSFWFLWLNTSLCHQCEVPCKKKVLHFITRGVLAILRKIEPISLVLGGFSFKSWLGGLLIVLATAEASNHIVWNAIKCSQQAVKTGTQSVRRI